MGMDWMPTFFAAARASPGPASLTRSISRVPFLDTIFLEHCHHWVNVLRSEVANDHPEKIFPNPDSIRDVNLLIQ
jgi:hypothetical protein